MDKEIYFTTTSSKLVNNYDIAKADIINGDTVDEYHYDRELRRVCLATDTHHKCLTD